MVLERNKDDQGSDVTVQPCNIKTRLIADVKEVTCTAQDFSAAFLPLPPTAPVP